MTLPRRTVDGDQTLNRLNLLERRGPRILAELDALESTAISGLRHKT
jgi:hypothetical protein